MGRKRKVVQAYPKSKQTSAMDGSEVRIDQAAYEAILKQHQEEAVQHQEEVSVVEEVEVMDTSAPPPGTPVRTPMVINPDANQMYEDALLQQSQPRMQKKRKVVREEVKYALFAAGALLSVYLLYTWWHKDTTSLPEVPPTPKAANVDFALPHE